MPNGNKQKYWWEDEAQTKDLVQDQPETTQQAKPQKLWWQTDDDILKPTETISTSSPGIIETKTKAKPEEELTTAQSIKNSLYNLGEQLGDVFEFYGLKDNEDGTAGAGESFDIAWNSLKSGILGPSEGTSEEILSSLKGYETEKAQTKRTKGILESIDKGDIGGAFAGAINAITNGIGSAAYGTATFGAGYLADYSAENYIEFNKLKAQNLNKSFNDLVKEGEADVAIPLGIAAVQSGMEAFALGKVLKVVGGKGGMNPLSSLGKELATKALYNKSARTTLSILGTGSTEFITEIGQHAAEQVNKELGRVAGTDEEAKIKDTIIDAVTSQEGLEAGIQGFIGGAGMAGGSYSARALSATRNIVSPVDIEADMLDIVELDKKIKEEESKENYDKALLEGKKETLKKRKIALSDKKKKGDDTYLKMEDDQILEVEDKDQLANIAAYKLTELNKKLDSGQITKEEYDTASEGFRETYNKAKARINEIIYEADKAKAEEISKETGLNVKKSATEQEYADDIIKDQSADNESDPNNFNNEKELDDFIAKKPRKNESKKAQEKRTAAINLKKKIERAKATGGLFSGKGKIFINEKLSKAQGDVSVNTHEVLHPILNALVGNRAEQGKIVKQLKKAATWNQRRYVAQQLRTRRVVKEDHDTEWINILSDGIIKGEVGYDKNTFEKMGDAFKSIFGAKQVSTVGFEDGQQVYNFIKEYTSTSPDGAASKIALKAIKDAEAKAKVKIKDIGGVGGSQASNLNQMFEAMHPEKAKEDVGEFMDTMLVDKQTGIKTDNISNTPFADQIGGMVGSIINRTYNNVKDPNSYTKDDYKRDLLNEAILLVKNEYNPELQSLDKFLSNRLNLRANNLIDRLGERGDIKTESMTRQMAGADEGTPARQFASDAPSALDSMIEVQDELQSQDNSIRKELEIEDGSSIYNEVIALVKEEISNIEGVIKQSDILNIKNKLVKTFGKALQKTLKNRIGGDKEHRAFVKKYSLVIYNKFTTKQLTALARELGNDNYFTYKPLGDKKLSYSQALAAQNMDLIEVKNLKSGPVLRLKYNISEETDNQTSVTPETIAERFNEYFFPPAINPVTGERSSKKGTRKDAMARNIGAEMAFDAVMQVLTSPEVIQFRASKLSSEFLEDTDAKIQELEDSSIDNIVNVSKSQGKEITEQEVADQIAKEQLKAEIAIVSKAISRDPGFQFSNIASEDKKVLKDNAPNIIGFLEQMLDIFNGPITEENKSGIEKLNVNDDLKKALTSLYNELFESNTVVVDNTINTEKEALNSAYFSKILKNIDPELANFFETKKHLASFKDGKTRVVNQEVTDTLADGSKTLLESLPKEFHELLRLVLPPSSMYQIFGQGYRALDAAKGKQFYDLFNFKNYTKDDSPSFNYEVEKEKAKTKTEIDYVEALNDLLNLQKAGILPEPQIVSSKKATLLGTIRDKFKGKKSLTPEEQTRLEKVNEANRALLKVVTLALKKEYKKRKIGKDYLVPIFFSQSLMTRGFRALSQIQGFMFKTTNESGNIIDATMNKGEHININGNSMAELYQYITENKNLKQKSLYDIITDHAQVFGDKKTFDKLDSKHGLVSTLGINRIINALTSSEIFNSFSLFKGDRKTFLRQAITSIDNELQFSNNKKTAFTEEDVSPMSQGFNQIIEQTKDVKADETFSETVARQRGATIGKYKFFIPPSAEDFMGLIYSFLSKGTVGDAQKQFFETYLNAPYKRGIAQMESAKQKIEDDYRKLRQKFKPIAKKLGKKIPELKGTKLEDFTYDQAVRIYLWDYSTGFDNVAEKTGLDEADVKRLAAIVQNDTELTQFARGLGLLTGLEEGYVQPTKTWLTDNIASDLSNIVDKIGRKQFLDEFIQNKNEIFSKENLNKIEATYGSNFREAMEDMLFRMENGTNRNFGKNRLVNQFSNWINNSVGAIMFFNMRSAVLQIISSVNFLNWSDNNPLAAATAFANQPQFWSDFALIFNSDKLKQRRKGLKTDVNQAELANSVADSKNKAKAALRYLLKIGFAPTQIADSFAIAVGGASMYRNRVNTYKKQGMSIEEAEKAAFEDFGAIAEETQQSSDPALVSQQQSGPLGRLILAFQNTPMQYARLIKKSILDLANGRGDAKTHISKIVYYTAIQNIIFSSMQTALFAMMFDDDEDDDEMKAQINKKENMVANGMLDTLLRGTGIGGAAVATIKNAIMEYYKQENKEYGRDHAYTIMQLVNVSPPIGSKLRKVYNAIQTNRFEKDVIDAKGFELDSPIYRVGGNLISAATNLPADRLVNKLNNIAAAADNENKTWQRIALALGWNTWDLNVKNEEHELIKTNAKDARRKEGYKKAAKKRKTKNSKTLLELQKSTNTKRKSLLDQQRSASIKLNKD